MAMKQAATMCMCLAVALGAAAQNAAPVSGTKLSVVGERAKALWSAPDVEARIQAGIRENRMGTFAVTFTSADGKPLENAEVKAELVRHEFLFGCNGFMVKGFTNAVENAKYEEAFLSLFNQITIPYYWKGIEPEQGKLRFGKDSQYLYRRPPPDTVIEFADKHGVQFGRLEIVIVEAGLLKRIDVNDPMVRKKARKLQSNNEVDGLFA